MWPDRRILDLFNIEHPIIQAPMAGASGTQIAIAVSRAGGLGSLPCATLNAESTRSEIGVIRQQTGKPLNANFFCHVNTDLDPARDATWKKSLAKYYAEFDVEAPPMPGGALAPFDDAKCEVVEDLKPDVVSFHFGLPGPDLLARVRATGACVMSSATTISEAHWLEDQGCDAIIAQGFEAGGHRGMFLTEDISTQMGTMALVPQVVDAVSVPVIAAGGIADGRGIAAALALGAAAVQIGTAYLFTPQALITDLHRAALRSPASDQSALTNLFSGRPARSLMNRLMREVGPMSSVTPAFPTAGGALAPLKEKAETAGDTDFSSLWSGQAAGLAHESDAGALTSELASDALARLKTLTAEGE